MTVICVLYILIGIKLRQSKLLYGKKVKSSDSQRYIKGQSRVVRMLGESKLQIDDVGFCEKCFFCPCSTFQWWLILTKVFVIFSCCCCDVLSLLGTVSRTANHGSLWENNEKVIQQRRLIHENLRCVDIYLWDQLLSVNVYQSCAIQYYESQIPECFEGIV